MQKITSKTKRTYIIIIILLAVILLGVIGIVVWGNVTRGDDAPESTKSQVSKVKSEPQTESCTDGENVTAKNGVFCSDDIGIKLKVPAIFSNRLAIADTYEVFQGPLDIKLKTSAGHAEKVYSAVLEGNDNFTLTISQEPLRTGYVGVHYALQNAYFDQKTGDLTLVKPPTSHYNASTDITTMSGDYAVGAPVPSFNVGDVRFFKGSSGDAGALEDVYFSVLNDKIVKISLKYKGYMGDPAHDPTTIEAGPVFAELNSSVKELKVIKR